MYQRILLAFDGSTRGRAALKQGADIAEKMGAETHLLAVMQLPASSQWSEGYIPDAFFDDEKKRVESILEAGVDLLKARGLTTTGHLESGNPTDRIVRIAKQENIDLIVIGHSSKGSVARWWQGSVGSSLVNQSPCSFLIAFADNDSPD